MSRYLLAFLIMLVIDPDLEAFSKDAVSVLIFPFSLWIFTLCVDTLGFVRWPAFSLAVSGPGFTSSTYVRKMEWNIWLRLWKCKSRYQSTSVWLKMQTKGNSFVCNCLLQKWSGHFLAKRVYWIECVYGYHLHVIFTWFIIQWADVVYIRFLVCDIQMFLSVWLWYFALYIVSLCIGVVCLYPTVFSSRS